MIRVVFFGSSDSVFSNRHFARLLESRCELAAVVDVPPQRRVSTNASRPQGGTFVENARARGVPCFEPARVNDPAFVQALADLRPDLFVAVGYMLLLGPKLLSVPRLAAANFHASLLPAYRGKHPVFWALRNGEAWCGLTVHEMSAGLDTGDIFYQVRVPVHAGDSVSALYDRIMAESEPLVSRLVDAAAAGALPRTPQGMAGASYFGATTEADFRIDWSMDPAAIARWVAATPGKCFTERAGQRLYLAEARPAQGAAGTRPGTILSVDADCCRVAAGGAAVEIRGVRPAEPGMTRGELLGGS